MNIFYAPPKQVYDSHIELSGQEAKHATKVLRYREGDTINIVDGTGGWYDCTIAQVAGSIVKATIEHAKQISSPTPEIVLAMGIIKKRDRLEFAVEKSVELGVKEIVLFRSRHTIKENIRIDRLEMTALSAMKQSLRAHLPEITILDNVESVLDTYFDHQVLVAHEKAEAKSGISIEQRKKNKTMLLVGPEGGFSEKEIRMTIDKGGQVISLGKNRLRAETAAVVFLSQFI
ncbi:16S rRNA (uracil(1498)-N(3))-methyltransferase [Balneolaceae bacterium YR4-1]|uniref:Ribosomal RNA small subunit methyltransferase E n=1 Tax=Halalkalibaculum roseum TaxID=2709311 RepID=A0A6M1SPC5_9BACT|nr:RsmE family RNA methyltransferase [Halalkalibaculum roseum]NGP76939.1 16S rRNA (uracil(1498)-N(3))-methyltransferase [Halalkalibaculum roseum]